MPSDFVQVASFGNPVEAEHIRIVLERNGIAAFVDGANVGTVLWHVGTALGGVRVLVRAADAERASEIIHSLDEQRDEDQEDAEAWFCGECKVDVEAGFAECWSCGRARSEVERSFPMGSDADLAGQREEDSAVQWHDDDTGPASPNPYASPRVNLPAREEPEFEPGIDREAEAMLVHAWRASVLGLLFPVIANAYSIYLLVRASTITHKFTPAGNRRFYLALAVNVIVCGLVLAMIFG